MEWCSRRSAEILGGCAKRALSIYRLLMRLRLLILDLFTSHRVKYLYLLPLYESERRRLDTFIDFHYSEEIGGDWRR